MRPIRLTVYLFADDEENPHKWNVAEWLDDPSVVGWDITDGHGDCAACAANTHEETTMSIKVSMPRANWDQIEMILEDLLGQGYIVGGLLDEIQQQTHTQEG